MASRTSADLTPHPLIPQVAYGLVGLVVPLIDSARELLDAETLELVQVDEAFRASIEESEQRKTDSEEDLAADDSGEQPDDNGERNRTVDAYVALALAGASNVPQLVTFVGYVGGRFREKSRPDTKWCVFYLDTRLTSWLLVDTSGIVFRDRLRDDRAPCRQRDVIWVKADTPVGLGNASEAAQAQFLTGEFTAAGDIDAPAGGGTADAATGVFCEARSVGCCKNNTYSRYCKP